MCGDYGKAIADTIAKEMSLEKQDIQPSPTANNQVSPSPQGSTPVQQFSIRSSSPPKDKTKPKAKGSLYSPEYASPSPQWAAPKHQDPASPSMSPNFVPKHKGHSDSVVYHESDLVSH